MKECVEKVTPVANRVLIFTTDVTSFHGHPEPMRCPEGVSDGRWPCTTSASRRIPCPFDRVPGPSW